MDVGRRLWARILIGDAVIARRVPVLWFDTSGGRDGPDDRVCVLGTCCSLLRLTILWLARLPINGGGQARLDRFAGLRLFVRHFMSRCAAGAHSVAAM